MRLLTCGGGTAPDVVVEFTAGSDDDYTFDTFGSSFDTVLYALDACGGAELACNDDGGGGGGESELTLALVSGETVYLVVDGFGSGSGPFTLNASIPPACADDLLSSTVPALGGGDTTGATNDNQGSCGGSTGPDHLWGWTAPFAATFTLDTIGSSYDTVLYVFDGCGGAELACNDDRPAGGLQSEVTLTLSAGQTVIVGVDGYNGSSGVYTLSLQ